MWGSLTQSRVLCIPTRFFSNHKEPSEIIHENRLQLNVNLWREFSLSQKDKYVLSHLWRLDFIDT